MSEQSPSEDRPDVSDINEAATREIISSSIEMCRDIAQFVYGGLTKFLNKDREQSLKLNASEIVAGESVDMYVLDDFLNIPGDNHKFQRSLSIKLKMPPDKKADIHTGDDELFAYVPVPEEFEFDSDEVPNPATVYIQHQNINGDYTRYSIGENGFTPFSTLSDGQEVTEFDLTDEVASMKRVDSGLPALAKIFENLVNMDIVPQRRIIVGQGVIDLE